MQVRFDTAAIGKFETDNSSWGSFASILTEPSANL